MSKTEQRIKIRVGSVFSQKKHAAKRWRHSCRKSSTLVQKCSQTKRPTITIWYRRGHFTSFGCSCQKQSFRFVHYVECGGLPCPCLPRFLSSSCTWKSRPLRSRLWTEHNAVSHRPVQGGTVVRRHHLKALPSGLTVDRTQRHKSLPRRLTVDRTQRRKSLPMGLIMV